MRKNFKYRARLNKESTRKANEWIDVCRWLYNHTLEEKVSEYKETGNYLSAYDQMKRLTSMKQEEPGLYEVGSQVLQDVITRVDLAFKAFFRRVKNGEGSPGFPRFKGMDRYSSFTLKNTGWKLHDNILDVRNIGKFRLRLSRPILGDVKTIAISKTPTGKWNVTFSCDDVPSRRLPESDEDIGIDVGISKFAVTSDNEVIENPKFYRKYREDLNKASQDLSRKKKGSTRRKKSKLRLSKIHEKIKNSRSDFHWKRANDLVNNYGTIYIEDMKSWSSWRTMNREMKDAAWFGFFDKLRFKAAEAGREVIEVPARGTTQECSACGRIVKKDLSERTHRCTCGLTMDRDLNAAINILTAGRAVRLTSRIS